MTQTETDNGLLPGGQDEIFLVDGSGYIFRAYYAMGQGLTNPEGVPVGAVLGFTNMILKLLTDLHAPSIAVIFDAARKNFRNEIYADYKANRSDTPEDLIPQFPLIREATEAFDIPAVELEGYEADDLIATYARLASEQNRSVTVVSSDKDLTQLIREGVRVYDPMKGRYVDENDVMEKFGVMPDRVTDVQALCGDATDNVPGVPGIGVKTAAQLINEYGDLETLLARAGEIKQNKRRESLIEHAEMARISKKLVVLDENAPVPYALEDLRARDPHTPKLAAFLQRQGFRSTLNRLGLNTNSITTTPAPQATPATQDTAPAPATTPKGPVECVNTLITEMDVLDQWIERASAAGLLCIDSETTGLTPAKAKLVGISLSITPGEAAYIPVGHTVITDLLGGSSNAKYTQLQPDAVMARLKPLLEDESVLKICHNVKYDWQMFANHGVAMNPVDDTMLMSYVLDGAAHGHGMDELSQLHLGHTPISYDDVTGKGKGRLSFADVDIDKALAYAAEDTDVTLRLYHILKPRLLAEKMVRVYEDIERPIIPVIARMEHTGIKLDIPALKRMSLDFGNKLAVLEKEIHGLSGHEFNIASPKQMGVVLFEEMGLEGGRKTKTGDWSTAVDVLEDLSGAPIIDKILEWRGLAKLKSTYTDALQEEINPATGRVHTSYNMTGTSTGRLSSNDPNLQNIPIRTEEGRKIREAFITEPGWKILSADYSQVELRLAAALADVKALKQAFIDRVDIHTLTASQVFGIPLDEVTPDIRRSAKAVNFGIIYGISGFGLSKQLGVSVGEASDFIKRYLNKFREIQDYMEACKDEARQHGYVRTFYGRKCFIPNINAKNGAWRSGAERQAINAPLQGTAADIMKLAMAKMPRALSEAGLNARMLIQVHDELVFEVPDAEVEQTKTLVTSVMQNVADVGVPLEAEAGFAENWAKAH
jgi:DNA polymerase-1